MLEEDKEKIHQLFKRKKSETDPYKKSLIDEHIQNIVFPYLDKEIERQLKEDDLAIFKWGHFIRR